MTNAAAAQITAEIVVDTIRHMAATEAVPFPRVVELLTQGHVNTVKRFNQYMDIAAKAVRG